MRAQLWHLHEANILFWVYIARRFKVVNKNENEVKYAILTDYKEKIGELYHLKFKSLSIISC